MLSHSDRRGATDACEDPEFEDARSEDENAESMNPRAIGLPPGIPTGASFLAEAQVTRAVFQQGGARALPLTEAVARCRDLMAKEAPPLFAFSRLLAEDQRHAIWSLFGVCHAFEHAPTLEDLEDRQRHLRRAFNSDLGSEEDPSVWCALRTTLCRYALIRRPFEDMASGIAQRPEQGTNFATVQDMLVHAYRSAGAIGLIALPVLMDGAALNAQVVEAAICLGMALQLTDMLNCVGHHRRTRGLCWIPQESLQRHGVPAAELERNLLQETSSLVGDARWETLMRELVAHVPPLLRRATQGGEQLSGGSRLAVRAAVRMCRRMVARIEQRGYNSLGPHEEMFSWRVVGDVAGAVWAQEPKNCEAESHEEPGIYGHGGL